MVLLVTACDSQGEVSFPTTALTIKTSAHTYTFTVEVPRNQQEMAQGLMFRKTMADDAGMLFIFSEPRSITMWMENTYLPLDMIFADAHGRIVDIVRDTTPLSRNIITSATQAMAVLEVKAGTVKKLGIQRGDTLKTAIWPASN